MFNCDGCGCCCENLNRNIAMQDMHSGNGVCFFLIKMTEDVRSTRADHSFVE